VKRGDVRWYAFKPPDKRRPVLVLTRNSIIEYLNEVTVAPITSTVRNIASEVVLGGEDGMPAECAVNLDHVQTVRKDRVGKLITALSREKLTEVRNAIRFALDL
jgi:mRNA interferase MazF